MERVLKIWISCFWKWPGLEWWVKHKFNKAFLNVLPNFWHFWSFFKVGSTEGTTDLWKIIKNGTNLVIGEEKPCSTCVQPITYIDFGSKKPISETRSITKHNYIQSCPSKIQIIWDGATATDMNGCIFIVLK